jgi:TetR/AcrR family transcriptional regulator
MARPKTNDPEARANILAAAEELFAAQGFAGTSVRDIAQQAGVTGAMVHYYFDNKEGLYRATIENVVGKVRELLAQAAESDAPVQERMRAFIQANTTHLLNHPKAARIVLRDLLAGGKEILKIFQKYPKDNYSLLRGIISEGVKRKELRPLDVEIAPLSLMGMIMVFHIFNPLISVVLGKPDYDDEFIQRVAVHTADLFLNGAQMPRTNAAKKSPSKAKRPIKAPAKPTGRKPHERK